MGITRNNTETPNILAKEAETEINEKDMSANYLTPKADERVGALLDAPPNEEILEAESKFTID